MLLIDIGNTLRTGSRTGIQRVVRELGYGLKTADPGGTRLIAFDLGRDGYVELADPEPLRSEVALDAIPAASKRAFDFGTLAAGDVFFEIDAGWNEPLDRGSLFRLLKRRGVIIVLLNHDVIPLIHPEVCHPNTIVAFADCIADHMQYADYALTTSAGVDRDLRATVQQFLGRSISTRIIGLGADFGREPAIGGPMPGEDRATFEAAFPELSGLRFLLSVGTIEPRKNHQLLLDAFDRLEPRDAAVVIVGRRGWQSEEMLDRYQARPDYGKRLFWYKAIDDDRLLGLYRHCHAAVMTSVYEGYGLPAVEALQQGCATVCSDAGALAQVTQGAAALFPSRDEDALFTVLDRLYRDEAYRQRLRGQARAFVAPSWGETSARVRSVLDEVTSGAGHDFGAPLRQMVFLATHPEMLDLSLRSVRGNLPFIDRIVVLTKGAVKEAIGAVAARHYPQSIVLSDEDVLGSQPVTSEHTPRNTWLRKLLYRQPCIEANFVASDEDYFALAPLTADYFRQGSVHVGRYFLEDMGTWLAGSPNPTSYDGGVRNAWRVLRQAGYPARGCASHVPQIVNKSLVNQIYDRFMVDTDHAWLDEWSLYFNVAAQLYPKHFAFAPYAALGWPMHMGDWLPQVAPEDPVFENYYPESYVADGMFVGLDPLGDLAAKTERTFAALAQARRVESGQGQLVLSVSSAGLTFAGGPVVAGKGNVRRILLINRDAEGVRGRLNYFLAEESGVPLRGETVRLGEVCWLPLLPPDKPGRYRLHFFLTLPSGTRLETNATLEVIADVPGGGVVVREAPHGSDLYRGSLALREAVLRAPLGLTLTEEELAQDATRAHFCAVADGAVIGSASLHPIDGETLQLRQMAVAEARRGEAIGARLLAFAEGWARAQGFRRILLHARMGADGFYAKFGYAAQGEPFDENTIPHIKMTKRLA
jgi:glycosyltransferase involved in cell wall biosynthesis/predicted GNAT family N-acyltransferase